MVKGTTTGTRLEGGSYTCQTQTDSCQDSNVVREWYVNYLRLLVYQDYDCRQRTDGKIRCADGRCVECTKDDDCKDASGNWRYDPVNHTKIVCDCPSGSCSYKPKVNDYTCKALPKCEKNGDCAPGWCCVADPTGPDSSKPICVSQGIYSANPKYLCDPPGWNSEEASKKQSLLDLLLSFFFNP
ncbi:MAG: hypothetical protein QW566_02850, partial [Candidatus Jordarchaeales archaeon]